MRRDCLGNFGSSQRNTFPNWKIFDLVSRIQVISLNSDLFVYKMDITTHITLHLTTLHTYIYYIPFSSFIKMSVKKYKSKKKTKITEMYQYITKL